VRSGSALAMRKKKFASSSKYHCTQKHAFIFVPPLHLFAIKVFRVF
jgi:hypothetical protein